MAITIYGIDPSIGEEQWAELMEIVAGGEIVDTGYAPSTGGATRLITIGTGTLVAAGVLAVKDATNNLALAANGSGNPRVDIVCLQIDWDGTSTTGGTIVAIQGATAPEASLVDPALTQIPGDTWQVPLARVIVRNGVTTIASGDVRDIRPLRRAVKLYGGGVDANTQSSSATNPKTVRTDDIPDPGWPYRLQIYSSLNFGFESGGGKGRLVIEVGTNGATPDQKRNIAAPGSNAGAVYALWTSGVLNGPATVLTRMLPHGGGTGITGTLDLEASGSYTDIQVIPA